MPGVYYELIVKGDQNLLSAYLQGFLAGRKIKEGVIFSRNYPIQIHHLRELIHYHGEVLHLVCRAAIRPTVVSAIKSAPAGLSFEIKVERKVSSASFGFEFETVSKDVATDLKRTFASLPKELKMKGFKPREEIDPEAKGPEGYAPMPSYCYSGKGEVAGDVEALLAFYQKLSQNEFVRAGEILLS